MREIVQQHFTQFFGRRDGPLCRRNLTDFLAGLPHLSGQDGGCWDGSITAVEAEEALSDCDGDKSLYYSMPRLSGHLPKKSCKRYGDRPFPLHPWVTKVFFLPFIVKEK